MIEVLGRDLWGYSRAHMAYALFMQGFGAGYRMRHMMPTGRAKALHVDALMWRADEPTNPYDGGFRLGWLFEPLAAEESEEVFMGGCEAIGVGGFHSGHYADPDDGVCNWCGLRRGNNGTP